MNTPLNESFSLSEFDAGYKKLSQGYHKLLMQRRGVGFITLNLIKTSNLTQTVDNARKPLENQTGNPFQIIMI